MTIAADGDFTIESLSGGLGATLGTVSIAPDLSSATGSAEVPWRVCDGNFNCTDTGTTRTVEATWTATGRLTAHPAEVTLEIGAINVLAGYHHQRPVASSVSIEGEPAPGSDSDAVILRGRNVLVCVSRFEFACD